jgi:hypothetical protein
LKSPVIAHRIQGGVVLQPFALAESILDGFVKVIERLVPSNRPKRGCFCGIVDFAHNARQLIDHFALLVDQQLRIPTRSVNKTCAISGCGFDLALVPMSFATLDSV